MPTTSPHVDERSARVARVDGHIGLDEGQVVARVALLGAHDAGGDRIVQAKGRANGHHPLAHFQAADVTYANGRQTRGLDLHHRHIGALVQSHNAGLEFTLVWQGDQHLVGTIHHMGVGHDEAIGCQHKARPDTAGLFFLLLRAVGTLLTRGVGARQRNPKETAEQLLHFLIARIAGARGATGGHALQGTDIDHRGAHLLNQVGEIGQGTGLRNGRGRRHHNQGAHQRQPAGHASHGFHEIHHQQLPTSTLMGVPIYSAPNALPGDRVVVLFNPQPRAGGTCVGTWGIPTQKQGPLPVKRQGQLPLHGLRALQMPALTIPPQNGASSRTRTHSQAHSGQQQHAHEAHQT